ncbi:MAG: nucleoside 2-deoxyribosyltransferase [Salinivirgaceae bacterium]
MPIKIYFAGSIRGGRESADDYLSLILNLQKFGTVLTEHIAKDSLLANEKNLTDQQIHDRDLEWLNQCHIVVAEVTQPSLGVGYELAYSMFLNKPVLCLFNTTKGRQLSAMISGQKYFNVIKYHEIGSAINELQHYFNNFEFEQTTRNIVNK